MLKRVKSCELSFFTKLLLVGRGATMALNSLHEHLMGHLPSQAEGEWRKVKTLFFSDLLHEEPVCQLFGSGTFLKFSIWTQLWPHQRCWWFTRPPTMMPNMVQAIFLICCHCLCFWMGGHLYWSDWSYSEWWLATLLGVVLFLCKYSLCYPGACRFIFLCSLLEPKKEWIMCY